MTSKERMLIAMKNGQPDRVPAAPDISCMVPIRLTGKPFWDIELYGNPPMWKAYIDAVRYFGFDGWAMIWIPEEEEHEAFKARKSRRVIVERTPERIVTQEVWEGPRGREWADRVCLYAADTPAWNIKPELIGLKRIPDSFQEIEGLPELKSGKALYEEVRSYIGDDGVVAACLGIPLLSNEADIIEYYERYDAVKERAKKYQEHALRHCEQLIRLKPDFVLYGLSGLLTFQTPEIFRDLGLPSLKETTRMLKQAGIPTQLHACGRERAAVQIVAEETDLTSINPLEPPPMGDCHLGEIKEKFGKRLSLMGNLHTTDVMLRGTPRDVEGACKRAIDEAGKGGGFILSTGDQCGRDTPDENIFTMVRVAKEYGRY